MRHLPALAILLWTALLSGCSNTRFLTGEEILYTGRKNVEVKPTEGGVTSSKVTPQVRSITSHKVNNALFGRRVLPPVGLWVHNYFKEPENKKMRSWLYHSLESSPILVSDVNPGLRAQKIENDLFDQGYFRTRAWPVVDTSRRNPRKAMISYFVEVGRPYRYNQVNFNTFGTRLDTLINLDPFHHQIKPGDTYNLETLSAARNALSRSIQDQGYFYFSPDYIVLHADTTLGNNLMNLTVSRLQDLPPEVLTRYHINDIEVHITRFADTASVAADSLLYGDLKIFSSGPYLRPEALQKAIMFNRGELYSFNSYQNTVSKLNNMGIFSSVRITYAVSPDDSLRHLMDVRIDLLMADNISLDLEADLVMKSTGYLGPVVSAGISHNNSFRGAERIHVSVTGGFELQWGSKQQGQLGSFSYELGVNGGLTLPRIILPGPNIRIRNILRQQTSLNQSVRLLNRTSYYTMLSLLTNLNYNWGKRQEITHSLSPVYLNSVSLLATTPAFDSVIGENIYIRKSFEEQFILGMRYDFTYDDTPRIRSRNFYFHGGVSTSGNLIDALKLMGNDPSGRPFGFFGNIYSQHIKLVTDFRCYLHSYNNTMAMRMYAGIGIPYGNSDVLPYVEQFFSGGAYSIRGFLARTVGPGTFHETENTYIDQSGDVKLEGNLEYRFNMSRILKGAFFLDAGNIWLVNEDENRPGSRFGFSSFYRQLAVGAGLGLRFDFTFFVLRTDFGFPLRTPYTIDDRNWQIGTGTMFSRGMFYLAIGYPF